MAYAPAPVTPPRRPGPANLNQKDIYNDAAAARKAAAVVVYQVAGGFGALNLGGGAEPMAMDLGTPPSSP